jgi:hypothetical protein
MTPVYRPIGHNAIDRILGWIEAGFLCIIHIMRDRKCRSQLLEDFENAHASENYNWLSLRRLATAIYLDPSKNEDLDRTVGVLKGMKPPNNARQDRTPPNPGKPRQEMKWGLIKYVGK